MTEKQNDVQEPEQQNDDEITEEKDNVDVMDDVVQEPEQKDDEIIITTIDNAGDDIQEPEQEDDVEEIKEKETVQRKNKNANKNRNKHKKNKNKNYISVGYTINEWMNKKCNQKVSVRKRSLRSNGDDSDLQIITNDTDGDKTEEEEEGDENPRKKQKIDSNQKRFQICRNVFYDTFTLNHQKCFNAYIYYAIMTLKSKEYNADQKKKLIKSLLQDKLNTNDNDNNNNNNIEDEILLDFAMNPIYEDRKQEYNDK